MVVPVVPVPVSSVASSVAHSTTVVATVTSMVAASASSTKALSATSILAFTGAANPMATAFAGVGGAVAAFVAAFAL